MMSVQFSSSPPITFLRNELATNSFPFIFYRLSDSPLLCSMFSSTRIELKLDCSCMMFSLSAGFSLYSRRAFMRKSQKPSALLSSSFFFYSISKAGLCFLVREQLIVSAIAMTAIGMNVANPNAVVNADA